jgi:hypothetical protein
LEAEVIGSKSLIRARAASVAALLAAGALFVDAAVAAPASAPRDKAEISSPGFLHLEVDETIAPDPGADALTLRILLDRVGCRLAPDAFTVLVGRLALLPDSPGTYPLADLANDVCGAPSSAGGIVETKF